MRRLLKLKAGELISPQIVETVKMGTTVATNALLERTGARTAFFITKGFRDALGDRLSKSSAPLRSSYRFAFAFVRQVFEVDKRLDAFGRVIRPLDGQVVREQLQAAYREGFRALAVAPMHGYRYTAHEAEIARLASQVRFTQILVSHEVVRR